MKIFILRLWSACFSLRGRGGGKRASFVFKTCHLEAAVTQLENGDLPGLILDHIHGGSTQQEGGSEKEKKEQPVGF